MTIDTAILTSLKALLYHLVTNFLTASYDQRRESAIALSKFRGEKATDFLLETYASDNIQDFLALALGNIDSTRAMDLLIHSLKDSQQEVRFYAAQALGMLENPEAIAILMDALNTYAEASNCISANEQTDDSSSQIFFEEDSIISAILSIGKTKTWISISLLKKLLSQEKSGRIRASIIIALGMMNSDKLLPVFQTAMRDEDFRVRANAVEAIENIKSGSIVAIIQPYLEDPSNRVRANVAKAIWKYGDFDVSDTLKQMLEHTDKWYRASASYAIGEIKDARFIPQLSRALRDEDSDVRRNATNALRKIETENAMVHLKPMLDDPNFDVRVEATLAIARCSQDPTTILVEKLKVEENFIVQATIISCLGNITNNEMIPLIMGYLDSEDPRVISNSIDALSKLCTTNDEIVIAELKRLLSHEDNRVKSTAIRTLWTWGKYDVLDNLLELFNDPDPRLIRSATFVLGEIGKEISCSESFSKQTDQLLTEIIENPETSLALSKKQTNTDVSQSDPSEASEFDMISPLEPIIEILSTQDDTEDPRSKVSQIPVKPVILEQSFTGEVEAANRFLDAKNYDAAKIIFSQILQDAPEHLKALLGLANIFFFLKENSKAIQLYQKALEINPNIVKAHYNLGTIYYNTGKYDEAARHLIKALNIYPKILGAYLILGHIYQTAGRLEESIKLHSHAVALSPRNPIIYQKLANLHIQKGDYSSAVEILLNAIKISPTDVDSNLMLAYCFNLINRPQEAFNAMDVTLRACIKSSNQEVALKQLLISYLSINSILKEQIQKSGETSK